MENMAGARDHVLVVVMVVGTGEGAGDGQSGNVPKPQNRQAS